MKPHGEKFLAPSLPFAISGQAPTGRKAQEIQANIQMARDGWQSQIDPKVLVGAGSQNIPLLAAACGLGFTYENDSALHQKTLAGWRGYLTLPWWANEPGSRDIYGCWITVSILVAYAFAVKSGDQALIDGLRKLVRTTATILGLGAGWSRVAAGTKQDDPGYPVTICGARSVDVSERPTPPKGLMLRKDENGLAYQPNFLFSHPLNGVLQGLVDTTIPEGWAGDVIKACISRLGFNPLAALTAQERTLLKGLIEASTPAAVKAADLATVQGWLEEGPKPEATFHLIKTVAGTATVCEKGVNPGSTNPMYAYVWWAKERPASSALNVYKWPEDNKQIDCLFVDDPGTRQQGKLGIAVVDMANHVVKAQRKDAQNYFDDRTQKFVPGEKTVSLPDGDLLWHFRLTEQGVQLLS